MQRCSCARRAAPSRPRRARPCCASPAPCWPSTGARSTRWPPQTVVAVEEGDLTRLLPQLRAGELDLIAGRLEPGWAAPDLRTEALLDEPMALVVRPEHPLLAALGPTPDAVAAWTALAAQPWVMPPAWAASRPKLLQCVHRHGLHPPDDVVESASFLVMLTFVRERGAVGFVARGVAASLAHQALAVALPVAVPMELPPVGVITLAGRVPTGAARRMRACLREVAGPR